MLTDKEIELAKHKIIYSHLTDVFHEHNDCIRIAYEWLDAQKKIKNPISKIYDLKRFIERWGGRYVSQADVELAAFLHPAVQGKYPDYNISARLTEPDDKRLQEISEALKHQNYRKRHNPSIYKEQEKKASIFSRYNGQEFKTRLEAKWAAFFDLAGWSWWVNPVVVGDWQPDFKVTFKCDHSECGGDHTLLIAVLPVSSIEAFEGHPCFSHIYPIEDKHGKWLADGFGAFGDGPSVTKWDILHGSGGGTEDVYFRVDHADDLWRQTERLVKG